MRLPSTILFLLYLPACSGAGENAPTPDQAIIKKDGPSIKKDGPSIKKDGPVTKKDGPVIKKDGPVVKPDKALPKPDKALPKPDKALPKPDKALPKPDTGPPPAYTGTFPQGTGDLSATLKVAGYSRQVKIYKPASAKAGAPLMLLFHGTHGTANDMLKPYGAYAREMADKQGVVLASPQARKMTVGDWDDHYPNDVYWETYPSVNPKTNPDLLLVQAMIHAATTAYKVNTKRVYTLGHSNGGFFSILVAMTLPTKIAAFAVNSAGLVQCAKMSDCSFMGAGTSCSAYKSQSGYCKCTGPYKPVTVTSSVARKPPGYLVHASDDTTISVQYMCTLAERLAAMGYTYSLNIKTGHGHSMPYNLGVNAWTYLSKFSL